MKDVRVAVEASAKSLATYKHKFRVSPRALLYAPSFSHAGTNRHSYLCNSANVLVPVRLREAQILVQSKAHIVAVETVRAHTKVKQVLLERRRDGRLSGRRETCEPDRVSALSAERLALAAAEGLVPGDVAVGDVSCGFCLRSLVGGVVWRGRGGAYVAIFSR